MDSRLRRHSSEELFYVYRAMTKPKEQLFLSAPLMQTEHAPALGASVGYGFSPKGIDKGGLAASVDAGWRWQMTEKSALFVGIDFALQQGKATVAETIEGEEYESEQFRNFCRVGLKLAVQF